MYFDSLWIHSVAFEKLWKRSYVFGSGHWRIQAGARDAPRSPNSLIFMQCSAKHLKINTTFGSWLTPSGKSWLFESHQYIYTDNFYLLYLMLFAQFLLLIMTRLSNHLHGQYQWRIQDFPDVRGAVGYPRGWSKNLFFGNILCRKLPENEITDVRSRWCAFYQMSQEGVADDQSDVCWDFR